MPLPVIRQIDFSDSQLILTLGDGSQHPLYLTRYPALQKADAAARNDWQLSSDGSQATWPRLGGQYSITVDAVDCVWDTYCETALALLREKDWVLDALPQREREIAALWRLEADGYNGGFLQFFCNWGDANCQVAMAALQAIGAQATWDLVNQQRRVLDRIEDHPELKTYDDIYRLLSEEELAEINERIDPLLWDAAEEIPRLAVLHYS